MKKLITLFLLAFFAASALSEEGALSPEKKALCTKYNKLYDSIYIAKVFHGADSVKAVKRLTLTSNLFNSAK